MIKFTVNTMNSGKLKTLLGINVDDYVTLFVTKSMCYFILNSMEIYLHKAMPILLSDNLNETFSIRVERKKLYNLLIDGYMVFLIDEDTVTITFKNTENKPKYSIDIIHQKAFNEVLFNKMNLITKCHEYPEMTLTAIKSLSRVASNLGLPIGVSNGYAHAGNRMFSCFTQASIPDFAVNSRLLVLLLKFTDRVYNVQNYLIYDEEGTAIVLTKYKDIGYFDTEFVLKQKSSHRVVLNLENIIDLCGRVEKSDGTFILDVENSTAKFEKDKVSYSTPVDILDIKSASKKKKDEKEKNASLEDIIAGIDFNSDGAISMSEHNVPTVEIPTIVLTRLLPAMGLKKLVTISYKKTFMQVNSGKTYVTFARKEV